MVVKQKAMLEKYQQQQKELTGNRRQPNAKWPIEFDIEILPPFWKFNHNKK